MIGELAALGAAICWTISAVLYKDAVSSTKPISANIIRCTSTALILIVFLFAIGRLGGLVALPLYAVALTGLSGVIGLGFGDTLYMESLKLIGVARAVPITCTYPLFNLLFAILFLGRGVTLHVVLGAVGIVFGIWLLTRQQEKTSILQGKVLAKGIAAATATAIIWSVSIGMMSVAVALPETRTLDGAFGVNTLRVLSVAVFLLVSSPITDREHGFLKVNWRTFMALVSGGTVALALGWFFLAFSFLQIPEAQAVPISSTSPLFATLAGIVLLHEHVNAKNVAGILITVLGVFLIFTV